MKKTLLCLLSLEASYGFLSPTPFVQHMTTTSSIEKSTYTLLFAKRSLKKKNFVTVKQLVHEVAKDVEQQKKNGPASRRKSRRTRQRVEAPKQKYLYAAQRKALERSGVYLKKNSDDLDAEEGASEEAAAESDNEPDAAATATAGRRLVLDKNNPITIARNLGMNPATQACDASFAFIQAEQKVIPVEEPRIVGALRVGGDDDGEGLSGMYAYVIDKPAGWSILEGKTKKNKTAQGKGTKPKSNPGKNVSPPKSKQTNNGKDNLKRTKYYDEERGVFDVIEYDDAGMLAMMTPEEIEEFQREGGFEGMNLSDAGAFTAKTATEAVNMYDNEDDIEAMVDGAQGALDGSTENSDDTSDESGIDHDPASFEPETRPSVVSWLKSLKASEGTPIRGGKFWTAMAGAVEIDDTGLLVLAPKDKVENMYVDYADYVAVVGNGHFLAPKGKKKLALSSRSMASLNEAKIDVVAKLRKGRIDDVVLTSELSIPDGTSTTNDVVQLCQQEFDDGVRGDANANPLDRRANRRLIHCASISVSSLSHDDVVEAEVSTPDDIRMLSDRRNHHEYSNGSFLGRNTLNNNDFTTAYREINGAADGFPGWIVDRYDQWLFVQHDENYEQGPLPSLHDGNTAGVYYFSTDPDRSVTGAKKGIKPKLMEGQPAPEMISIKENGITYHANFDDLSTGIFLDQRSQRAWLSRFCTEDTKVLNCFSHCGAFSVAAATAGAETVSLDLDKKWLDRVGPQLRANGIDDSDGRHDCIYGDCFDWLRRFGKRGEKFDIVILDPPSTSVGGKKKKRWSAKNDYDELVSLAAPLVKEGGLLWTTTNSQQIHPVRFARMCKKGLDTAGLPNSLLERVASMPSDFSPIGPQNVKNFVWRIR